MYVDKCWLCGRRGVVGRGIWYLDIPGFREPECRDCHEALRRGPTPEDTAIYKAFKVRADAARSR